MLTVNFIAYVKYVLMYSTVIWNDVLLTEHFRWDGAKLSSICGWMDPACTRPAATIPMATEGKEIGLFCKIRLLVLVGGFLYPSLSIISYYFAFNPAIDYFAFQAQVKKTIKTQRCRPLS